MWFIIYNCAHVLRDGDQVRGIILVIISLQAS